MRALLSSPFFPFLPLSSPFFPFLPRHNQPTDPAVCSGFTEWDAVEFIHEPHARTDDCCPAESGRQRQAFQRLPPPIVVSAALLAPHSRTHTNTHTGTHSQLTHCPPHSLTRASLIMCRLCCAAFDESGVVASLCTLLDLCPSDKDLMLNVMRILRCADACAAKQQLAWLIASCSLCRLLDSDLACGFMSFLFGTAFLIACLASTPSTSFPPPFHPTLPSPRRLQPAAN